MREHWEHIAIATLGRASGHVDKLLPDTFSVNYPGWIRKNINTSLLLKTYS